MKSVFIPLVDALTPEDEAKAHIQAVIKEMRQEAAAAHAEGMHLVEQAARLSQILELLRDDEVVDLRDKLVAEGLIEFEVVEPIGQA